MGSSGEDPNKGIDASVGGLVWVRRRNGSWWPGRILSPDELPAGCVPTPRAGTPVKLLGREDASVDWYNLEKSKRIKAFHCGEYEDCIEKAKSAGSHLSKKGVKYARREDAILHALELESARLGKDHPDLSAAPDAQNDEQHQVDELSALHHAEEIEDADKDLNGSEEDSDSAQELSQSSVSFEEPHHVDSAKKETRKRRTPNDSEDDGAGGVKRMKGLEDLGMGMASSLKRKRSQVAHVHEFLKKKSRRRTLTKVLESTTVLPEPVDEKVTGPEPSRPAALYNKTSELEYNESKHSNSVLINTNSENNEIPCENGMMLMASGHANDTSLGAKQSDSKNSSNLRRPNKDSVQRLPVIPEERQYAGTSKILFDASSKVLIGSGAQSSQCVLIETLPLRNEEHNESGSVGLGAINVQQISDKMEKGTSEWQLKGKRNSRSRKVDIENEAEAYTNTTVADEDANNISRTNSDDTGSHQKSKPITDIQVEEFSSWSRNSPQRETQLRGSASEMPAPQRTLPYRQSRFTVNPKYDSSDFSLSHHLTGSGLYDVTIQVNTGNKPQHVPYISLLSKFCGQPIVGHPVTVEVLEDGFCDDLLNASEYRASNSNFNFNPCKNALVPALQGVGMAHNKLKARGKQSKKRGSHRKRSGSHTKPPKSKKNGIMSSKKIRKLSSLTGSQRLSREQKKSVMEKLKGPSIACVPLNVVFSRINAALV